MVDERLHRQAKLVARGVEAAEHQQDERVTKLVAGELILILLCCDQVRHAILARHRPAVGDQRVGIVIQAS